MIIDAALLAALVFVAAYALRFALGSRRPSGADRRRMVVAVAVACFLTLAAIANAGLFTPTAAGIATASTMVAAAAAKRSRRHVELGVLGAAVMLVGIGGMLAERYSGGSGFAAADTRSLTASVLALVAIAGLLLPRRLGLVLAYPRLLMATGLALYGLGTVSGIISGTGRTSLMLPGFGELVVADLARVLLVVGVTIEVVDRRTAWMTLRRGAVFADLIGPVLVAVAIAGLTASLTGDLGGAVLLGVAVTCAIAAAAARIWPLLVGLVSGAITLVVVLEFSARAAERWTTWLHPETVRQPTQVTLGLFALRSGGLTGRGLGHGAPEHVPLHESDFVLVAVGHELGVVGLLAVVALTVAIVVGLARMASDAADAGEAALCAAATTLIGTQAAVHLFGTTNLGPLTGVPYPFIARGGVGLAVTATLIATALHTHAGSPRLASDPPSPSRRSDVGATHRRRVFVTPEGQR